MRLFSKIKDYNSRLEEILEKKIFSANVKNLLLSMIYKVEISYKDYKEVKRVVKSQNRFIEEFIEIIDDYCDNIKIVEPDTKEANLLMNNHVIALTNERERSILCYPTENALLFAVSDIVPKYFYMSNDFIFKKRFQELLVNGFNLNNSEILNNFNGWSWDITQNTNMNYIDNLVYQNLIFMLGDSFLSNWKNYSASNKDFLLEMKDYIKSITGTNEFFYQLCCLLYKTMDKKEHQKVEEILKQKVKQLKKMQNREKFFEDNEKRKQKYLKLIEKIDNILKDENQIEKEFKKINLKLEENKKIKSVKIYTNMLKREKEMYIIEVNNISFLLEKINFLRYKQELELIEKIYNNKKTIEENVIDLQKEFLIFYNRKINKITTREQIIDTIYELRYIKNIPISKEKFISNIETLNNGIDRIFKKVITKACKIGIIKIISMDIALNYEIIKYALDTKIINLEQIKLNFELQEKEKYLIIKVYDKDIYEKQGRKKIDPAKDLLEVKLNKNIKLFN